MKDPKTFTVSKIEFLNNIEADWRRNFGVVFAGMVLNNAVRVERISETLLEVENDGGQVLRYEVKEEKNTARERK